MIPHFRKGFPALPAAFFLLFLSLFVGCGTLVDMGNPGASSGQRRVYVNDAAVNDSLRPALLSGGVYFVMQPGKKYDLRVEGAAPGDYLQLMAASGNQYNFWKNLSGTSVNGVQTYSILDSTATSAKYVLAFLKSSAGGLGTLPAKVRLAPSAPGLPDTLRVHLVMVRTLPGLPDSASKKTFAHSFLSKLTTTYAKFGIVIDTSYEILEPSLPGYTVDFNSPAVPSGTRIPNTVYMYLVKNITIDGKDNASGTILGFAPREAFDLATGEVVLSVQTSLSSPDPLSVAVTAAHEMGHFLGLRHTTSTQLDQQGDDDLSNTTDGFTETDSCGGLTKRMVVAEVSNDVRVVAGKPYCLRIAVTGCPSYCKDRTNLMFPYQCNEPQDSLVNQQKIFIRQNLSLFQK